MVQGERALALHLGSVAVRDRPGHHKLPGSQSHRASAQRNWLTRSLRASPAASTQSTPPSPSAPARSCRTSSLPRFRFQRRPPPCDRAAARPWPDHATRRDRLAPGRKFRLRRSRLNGPMRIRLCRNARRSTRWPSRPIGRPPLLTHVRKRRPLVTDRSELSTRQCGRNGCA
jgi:hypothetical protein